MPLLLDEPEDGSDTSSYVPVHWAGPAILTPAEAIGNIISRANDIISDHRLWLANLPLQKPEAKRQIVAIPQTAIPISALDGVIAGKYPLPPPETISIVPPFNYPLTSSPAEASIASLQSALNSANLALASVRQSASIALATASAALATALNNASIQSQSALAATQSASLAIASAQSTASASVLSANNAIASVAASASAAVDRANSLASGAQATATNAIAEAQATISAVASQASAAINASRISAMNKTTFVLVVTFSILGSSLLTIILFYLNIRYRRNRRTKKQGELKSKIRRRRHESEESEESEGPSLSEFPLPINRTRWSRVNGEGRSRRYQSAGRGDSGYWPRGNDRVSASDRERQSWMRATENIAEMVFPPPPVVARKTWIAGPGPSERERRANRQRDTEPFMAHSGSSRASLNRQTWSPSQDELPQSRSTTLVPTPEFPAGMSALSRHGPSRDGLRPSTRTRKNTLTYDPAHPKRQSVRVATVGPNGEGVDNDGTAIIGTAI